MFLARKVGSIAAACKTINICSITEGIFKQQDRSILSLLGAKQFHGSPVHSYSIEPEQDAVVIGEGDRKYEPQSPYRRVWPKHFQFVHSTNFGPTLPRVDKELKNNIPFKYKDKWSEKKALSGANDYIDILGDGSIHPVDLIRGPAYLIGFNANELCRLQRRKRFEGRYLRDNFPSKLEKILKRIKFLRKKYNFKRGKRVRKRFKYL
ncbi:large ribosomal subunit protein mL51-like [Crassostrea virginica]|uniref:Large ribosomal subunit protein mL51 n=1 Tax=Crassostrea virginica TaxID=6565 RepID=A0A8B8EU48_CRAVI|nr:39S ribosomal protein L51, mitochondrial-like [Crassostrea virginica]